MGRSFEAAGERGGGIGHDELELQRKLVRAAAAEAREEVLILRERLEARNLELESLRSSGQASKAGERSPSPPTGTGEALEQAEARLLQAGRDLREEFRAPVEAAADASNPMLRRAMEIARGQTRAQRAAALAAQAEAESRCSEAQRGLRAARSEVAELQQRLRAVEEDGRARLEALQALSSQARTSDAQQTARVQELESALASSRDELSRDKESLNLALQEARAEAEGLRQDLERERSDIQQLSQAAAARAKEEAESGRAEQAKSAAAAAQLQDRFDELQIEAQRQAAEHLTGINVLEKRLAESEEAGRRQAEEHVRELERLRAMAQEEVQLARVELEQAKAQAQEASRRQAEAYAQGLERVQTEARGRVQQAKAGLQQSEAKAKEAVQLQGEVLRLQLEQDKAERAAQRLREEMEQSQAAAEDGLERANTKAEESRVHAARLVEELEDSRKELQRLTSTNMSQRYRIAKVEDAGRLQAETHAAQLEQVRIDAREEAEAASRLKDEEHIWRVEQVLASAREEARVERNILEKALARAEEDATAERAQLQSALAEAAATARQREELHAQDVEKERSEMQREREFLREALAKREAQLEEELSEARREAKMAETAQAATLERVRSEMQQASSTQADQLEEAEARSSQLKTALEKHRVDLETERGSLTEQIRGEQQRVRGLEAALTGLEANLGEKLREALAERAHVEAQARAAEAALKANMVDLELQLKSVSVQQEYGMRELRDAYTAEIIDYESQVATLEESLVENRRALKSDVGERDILILQLKGEAQAREDALQEAVQALEQMAKDKAAVEAHAAKVAADSCENLTEQERKVAELRQQINTQALEHENHEAEMDEALAGALARAEMQERNLTQHLQDAEQRIENLVKAQDDAFVEAQATQHATEGFKEALREAHCELATLRLKEEELRAKLEDKSRAAQEQKLESESLLGQLKSSREKVSEMMAAKMELEEELLEVKRAAPEAAELPTDSKATYAIKHNAEMLLQLEKVKRLLDEKNLKAESAEEQIQRLAQVGQEVARALRGGQGPGVGADLPKGGALEDSRKEENEQEFQQQHLQRAAHSEALAALQSKVNSQDDQILRLEVSCEALRHELQDKRKELFSSKKLQEDSERRSAALQGELEVSKNVVQRLSEENEGLHIDCSGHELQANELKGKLESKSAEVRRLSDVVATLEEEQAEISLQVADLAALGLDEGEEVAPCSPEAGDPAVGAKEAESLEKVLLKPMQAMLAEVAALRLQCEDQAALLETSRREAIESASVQAEVGVQMESLLAENAQLLRAKAELEQQNEALGQACALGDTVLSWESEESESEAQESLVNSTKQRRKKWLKRLISVPALIVLPVLAAGRLADLQSHTAVRGGLSGKLSGNSRQSFREPTFEEEWER